MSNRERVSIPRRAYCLLPILALGCALAGCGPRSGAVTGNVSVDGQPLNSGVISFTSSDSAGPPVTVRIAQGKYEAQMCTGKKHVMISAPVVVEKVRAYNSPDAPLMERTEESLPPRCNSRSELTCEIKPGANQQDWNLESIRAERPGMAARAGK